jgi:hypothetical protein
MRSCRRRKDSLLLREPQVAPSTRGMGMGEAPPPKPMEKEVNQLLLLGEGESEEGVGRKAGKERKKARKRTDVEQPTNFRPRPIHDESDVRTLAPPDPDLLWVLAAMKEDPCANFAHSETETCVGGRVGEKGDATSTRRCTVWKR